MRSSRRGCWKPIRWVRDRAESDRKKSLKGYQDPQKLSLVRIFLVCFRKKRILGKSVWGIAVWLQKNKWAPSQTSNQAFRLFDDDETGKISFKNLKRVAKEHLSFGWLVVDGCWGRGLASISVSFSICFFEVKECCISCFEATLRGLEII